MVQLHQAVLNILIGILQELQMLELLAQLVMVFLSQLKMNLMN